MIRFLSLFLAFASTAAAKPVTVDDLMKLRSIVDVRIAPDGTHVAYVVSTPSVAKNEHEVALFVAGIDGGEAKRAGETVRILNTPLPAPRLRWTADSTSVALLGIAVSVASSRSVQLRIHIRDLRRASALRVEHEHEHRLAIVRPRELVRIRTRPRRLGQLPRRASGDGERVERSAG